MITEQENLCYCILTLQYKSSTECLLVIIIIIIIIIGCILTGFFLNNTDLKYFGHHLELNPEPLA